MNITFNNAYFTVVNESKSTRKYWSNVKEIANTDDQIFIIMNDGEQIVFELDNTTYETFAALLVAIVGFITVTERPYTVYKALMSQTTVADTSGTLVEGKTYIIDSLKTGDDFSNVGYVEEGTAFVATGTTPTDWTNSTSVMNLTDSAPTVTILENSIGDIVWAYDSVGVFTGTLAGKFTEDKTYFPLPVSIIHPITGGLVTVGWSSEDEIVVSSYDDTPELVDDVLDGVPIEIQVYS